MDNETPRYASWIPAAGGYVANGNVVSKSPIYDEAGKLKLDVDTSVFGNTNPSHSTLADQGHRQLAQKQAGMSTLNIAGSNEDANATATGIGSMGNLSQNTQNAVDSVLSSPAMRSPSAGEPILSIEQQDLKEIQDAKARNDLQGMINGYVKLGRDTGVDYSATISDLTKQRQQKIQGIDDQYLQLLDEARRNVNTARDVANISGDKEDIQAYNNALAEYNNLLNEQGNWRNSVGYADAMAQMQATKEEELQIDFDFAYNTAINDIANQLIQMYPSILNFQYNPNTDTSLYIAQGYAQSRVKETMNATGMYYSTMTQSAISKAVAELVPVYEKMARQEAIENFQLLQSTASFLMNLEQTQFNLWKSQIELKWQENAEKRKAIAQAKENANARGYCTNEEAALLGVAPGTESPDARARAQAKQDQIEAEQRKLIQDKALERFKTDMDIELLEEQNKLKESNNQGDGNTVTTIEYNPETGKYEVKQKTTLNRSLTEEEINTMNAANEAADDNGNDYSGDMTGKQLADSLSTTNMLTNTDKVTTLEYIKNNAKSKSEAEIAANNITEGSNKAETFAKDILQQAGIDGLITYYKALDSNRFLQTVEGTEGTLLDAYKLQFGDDKVNENNVGLISILASDAKNKDAMISNYIRAVVKPQIEATQFGSTASETKKNQKAIQDVLGDYAVPLLTPSLNKSINTQPVAEMYKMLADKIIATPNYDVSAGWFNQGKKGMSMGIQNTIIDLRDNYQQGKLGNGTAANKWGNVITELQNYAKGKESTGEIQGWEKASKNWDSAL